MQFIQTIFYDVLTKLKAFYLLVRQNLSSIRDEIQVVQEDQVEEESSKCKSAGSTSLFLDSNDLENKLISELS